MRHQKKKKQCPQRPWWLPHMQHAWFNSRSIYVASCKIHQRAAMSSGLQLYIQRMPQQQGSINDFMLNARIIGSYGTPQLIAHEQLSHKVLQKMCAKSNVQRRVEKSWGTKPCFRR